MSLTFVTDREAGSYYNVSDLNRVEAAVAYLDGLLVKAGYISPIDEVKSWAAVDIPLPSDMERYFTNVKILRDILPVPDDTPAAPLFEDGQFAYEGFTHDKANDVEKILQQQEQSLDYMLSPLYYKASGNTHVTSGSSSQLWRAGKTNTPSAVLATYITIINATVFTTLSDTVASQADAVAELQVQVDTLIRDSMTATINVSSYTDNISQTGSMVFTVTVEYGSATQSSNSCTVGIAENAISITLAQQAAMLEAYTWATLSEDATSEALATAEMQDQVDDVVSNGTVSAISYTSNSGETGSYSFVVVLETNGISLTTDTITVAVTESAVVPNVEFLSYLKGTGANWLDTDYYLNNAVNTVEATFVASDEALIQNLFGNIPSSATSRTNVIYYSSRKVRCDYNGSTSQYTNETYDAGTDFNVLATPTGVTVNDVLYARTLASGSVNTVSAYIFYAAGSATSVYYSTCGCKYFKIYDANMNLVMDLVPVKVLDSGLVTMYDYVSQTILTPQGTGSFTAVSKDVPEYGYVAIAA